MNSGCMTWSITNDPQTGLPREVGMRFAYKELGHDGCWTIYLFPKHKMGGVYYSRLEGFLDELEAEQVVEALNARYAIGDWP